MSLGLVVAGSGMAIVGFLSGYWMIAVAVMVSGIGVAIFHPEGSRAANHVSGKNKSTGMSVFSVGGNLGYVVGPLIVSVITPALGLKGTAVFMIPSYAMAVVLMLMFKGPQAEKADAPRPGVKVRPEGGDDWNAFAKLSAMVFFRSAALFGVTTFLPIYWVDVFKETEAAGGRALALYSLAAACATLIGGRLADRFGFTKIIRISVIAYVPALYLFTLNENPRLAVVLLIPIGLAANLCFSTVTVLGQTFLPNHIGFASGVTIGMSVSIGGVTAPVLGRISDLFGLVTTFYVITITALIAAVAGCIVPRPR